MEEVYRKVKAYIEKHRMISGGDVIVAGVSGGADSVCMLHLLVALKKILFITAFVRTRRKMRIMLKGCVRNGISPLH